MFQLIAFPTPQCIEKVTIELKDTPTKVYKIGDKLILSKVPLEVLQNWVLIQLIVTPHKLEKVQGQIREVCQLIEPCLLIGTKEYFDIQILNILINQWSSGVIGRLTGTLSLRASHSPINMKLAKKEPLNANLMNNGKLFVRKSSQAKSSS